MRAVFSLWVLFVAALVSLLFFWYLAVPLLQNLVGNALKISSDIYNLTEKNLESIQDDPVAQAMLDSIQKAREAIRDQNEIYSTLIKYGWIIILALSTLVIFIASRVLVEVQVR
jgi:hypothetical protein